MIAAFPVSRPIGTAVRQRVGRILDVILHVGAHRCATTSFQRYLQANADALLKAKTEAWGPEQTRASLFRGLQPAPQACLGRDSLARAIGRVQLACRRAERRGVRTLVISDANMLGGLRANLRLADLYCGAGERMARLADAFDHRLRGVAVNIRSLDTYWASVFRYSALRGQGCPHPRLVARVADCPRSWRDVITDLARALPGVPVQVLPFEGYANHPDAQLGVLIGGPVPRPAGQIWLARTPVSGDRGVGADGAMPFSQRQRAALRESYADDLMWLAGGADGLARLVPAPARNKAGQTPPLSDMTRGRDDERRHIHVARDGRGRIARQAG